MLTDRQTLTGVPSIDRPWRKFYTKEQLSICVPEMTLTDYVYSKNKCRLDLPALRYLGKSITYEELFDKIDQTARCFRKLGVNEGDNVALALPLIPEVIYMIYGLDRIGASANLIDPRVPSERMNYYINLTQTKLAVVISSYMNTMCKAAELSEVTNIVSISPIASLEPADRIKFMAVHFTKKEQGIHLREKIGRSVDKFTFNIKHLGKRKVIEYRNFCKEQLPVMQNAKYTREKAAIVEYTSGTTGIPKGLEMTACGMNVTAEQISIINKATPGDSILAIMPPFISYGAVTGIHMSLASGMEMILVPNFSTEHFAEYIKASKPNNIICVPSMFGHVIKSSLLEKEDLSYLKRLIFGGDRTTPDFEKEVNDWLHAHNAPATLIKGGGMAEFSSCCFETPFEETKQPGIYGIPLPLVDAKIMKNDHLECGYNEIGEIYISSPQQMLGYVKNPKETEEFFYTDENGIKWGRSGDLGYVDKDGFFTLTSRKKQMIIRPDGHNVFPGEIENVIKKSGFVKECVVIGLKDENSVIGEYPFAFIEFKEPYLSSTDEMLLKIEEHVKKHIPVRDRPADNAYYYGEMIYSSEGKLDRNAMLLKLQQEVKKKNIGRV